MNASVIETRAVTKDFERLRALDRVDLAVEPGELFGLIGHNGAGKSTLFRMMLGLIAPTSGEIRILGESVHGAVFRDVRRKVGYLPENVVFYGNLTGIETLRFFARLKGASEAECAGLLERVGLQAAARRYVGEYSKGMRQRLGLAQALLGKPALLFLDEPTTGLDPEAIHEFYTLLQELRGEGVTMILSSHILSEIQERVTRLAILRAGRIQASGSVHALREQMDLPLAIELRLAEGLPLADIQRDLAAAGAVAMSAERDALRFACPRKSKMKALAVVAALNGAVLDVHVREPSLEDVYMGYAG